MNLWVKLTEIEKLGQDDPSHPLIINLTEQDTDLEDDRMVERFAAWSILQAHSCRRFVVVHPTKNLAWQSRYQHLYCTTGDKYISKFVS